MDASRLRPQSAPAREYPLCVGAFGFREGKAEDFYTVENEVFENIRPIQPRIQKRR